MSQIEQIRETARLKVDSLNIDETVRSVTAFSGLQAMVSCTLESGYLPTLPTRALNETEEEFIFVLSMAKVADAYDAEMVSRGSSCRAWRGHNP